MRDPRWRPARSGSEDSPTRPPELWTGRRLALNALVEFERNRTFVADALEELFDETGASGQERGFATELANGCVRRMITLDLLIEPCVSRPRENIEDGLWILLRLGVYQLLFMRGLAPHAAVHETVELANTIGMPRWQGMVNAVLRQVQRTFIPEGGLDERQIAGVENLTPDLLVTGFREVSSGAGEGESRIVYDALRLREPLGGDPRRDLVAYLARTLSYPEWLVGRWRTAHGDDEALRLGAWFNTQGIMSLRVNLLRTDRETVLQELASRQIAARPGELPESIVLESSIPLAGFGPFQRGEVTVQDVSAMGAARLLDPQPGERVWDVCAAPGGKTTHLAERMRNEGSVLATDINPPRVRQVSSAAERLGLTNVASRLMSPESDDAPTEQFDAILLDVPCSNTGVLGKRPEVRWRLSPSEFSELTVLQRRLLDLGISRLRPGGRLLYSTCSIEPEEDGLLIRNALGAHPDLSLRTEQFHRPGRPGDGGYQALIVRAD